MNKLTKAQRKTSSITYHHKIDARSKNLLVVTTTGNVNAIQAMTFRGAELDLTKRKRHWVWQKKFPFLVRKELGVYTTLVQPRKLKHE